MATKIMGIFAFYVVLILCQEIVCVEGRHLKHKVCKKCSKGHEKSYLNGRIKNGGSSSSSQMETSKAEYVNDFRPTTPGHSPGIDNKMQNDNIGVPSSSFRKSSFSPPSYLSSPPPQPMHQISEATYLKARCVPSSHSVHIPIRFLSSSSGAAYLRHSLMILSHFLE
ncbi:Uncharacterized protein Fot_21023 [Forsythia ovata]|uniref:Uncharacterized protein n=1 Tax=Forsythia ovata TaxID=205694 RepID=A0ABD1UTT7_9LAMI